MDGFFQEKKGSKKVADDPAMRLTRSLHQGLKKHHTIQGVPNLKRDWYPHFEKLLDDYSEEKIKAAIDWYIHALEKGETQKLWGNAKAFCNSFRLILKQMNSPGFLSEDAKTLVERYKKLEWPAGIKKHLPYIIQESLDRYSMFICKEKEVYRTFFDYSRLKSLVRYLNDNFLSDPKSFVDGWMARLHDDIKRFPKWFGSVDSLVFDIYGERFTDLVEKWTEQFCGERERWVELRNLIMDAKNES